MKFNLDRSITIKSDLASLHKHLTDLRNWPQWSPWLSSEPDAHVSFNSDGSHQEWKGKLIGEGSLTVKNVQDNFISYNLHFLKPFASQATTSFSLHDNNDGSILVTWDMNGNLPWFMLFAKNFMAAAVGMDYDRGLHMLKSLIETGSIPSSLTKPQVTSFDTLHYVGVTTKDCPLAEINTRQPSYKHIALAISPHGKTLKPINVCHSFKITSETLTFTAGFTVDKQTANAIKKNLPEYTVGSLQGGRAIHITHTGNYNYLSNAWSAALAFSRYKKLKIRRNPIGFEIYTHMDDTNPNAHITEIFNPLR